MGLDRHREILGKRFLLPMVNIVFIKLSTGTAHRFKCSLLSCFAGSRLLVVFSLR